MTPSTLVLRITLVEHSVDVFDFRFGARQAITIGRAPENTVRLDAPAVSRFHASLEWRARGLWLSDLHSRNGTWFLTYVRSRVRPNEPLRLLPDEDRFAVGPFLLLPRIARGVEGARVDNAHLRFDPAGRMPGESDPVSQRGDPPHEEAAGVAIRTLEPMPGTSARMR